MGLFGKKDKDAGGDDSNRAALFSNRSKDKSPAASSQNPYANAPPSDPYIQAKMNAYGGPPPGYGGGLPSGPGAGRGKGLPSGPAANKSGGGPSGGPGGDRYGSSGGYPNEKSPSVTGQGGRYGAPSGGYGGGGYGGSNPYGNNDSNPYGSSGGSGGGGGYGENKYGSGNRYGSGAGSGSQGGNSRYGSGGYGGMGGAENDEENRGALFGGAKERVEARQREQGGQGDHPPAYGQGGDSGGYGDSSQGYGGGATYEDRQLTAEEEEEQDVNATKQQMRFMKQQDVSSTRNALRIAQQAEETGRDTLARLGAQGEQMHNTKKNLDLSHNQNRIAEERARELKTLNRSMFAVHVSNPFTANSRRSARDQAITDKHLDEKAEREATRLAAYQTEQRMQRNFQELNKSNQKSGSNQRNLAERAKYQFEADSEDEEMENEIDSNLDALHGAAGRLHNLAKVTGEEVDRQNKLLDEINSKSDQVDLGLVQNRAKIDRIR